MERKQKATDEASTTTTTVQGEESLKTLASHSSYIIQKEYKTNHLKELDGILEDKERELQEQLMHQLETDEKTKIKNQLELIKRQSTRYDKERLAMTKTLIQKTPTHKLEQLMNNHRSKEQKQYAKKLAEPREKRKPEKEYSFLPNINKNVRYGRHRMSIFERAKQMNASKKTPEEIESFYRERDAKRKARLKAIKSRAHIRGPQSGFRKRSKQVQSARKYSESRKDFARGNHRMVRFDDSTLDEFPEEHSGNKTRLVYHRGVDTSQDEIDVDSSYVDEDDTSSTESTESSTISQEFHEIKVPKLKTTKITRRRYKIIRGKTQSGRKAMIQHQYAPHLKPSPTKKNGIRRKLISKQVFTRQRMVDESAIASTTRKKKSKKRKKKKKSKKEKSKVNASIGTDPIPLPESPKNPNSHRKRRIFHVSDSSQSNHSETHHFSSSSSNKLTLKHEIGVMAKHHPEDDDSVIITSDVSSPPIPDMAAPVSPIQNVSSNVSMQMESTQTDDLDAYIQTLVGGPPSSYEEYDPYSRLTEEVYRTDDGDDGLTVFDMPRCDCGCQRVLVELLPKIKMQYLRENSQSIPLIG